MIRIVYNPSDGAPRGFYLVLRATGLRVGERIVAGLHSDTTTLAATRSYLPRSVLILKQTVAIGSQRVCIRDAVVYIDDAPAARRLDPTEKAVR